MSNNLRTASDELAAAVARASRHVAGLNVRRRFPVTGIIWRPGVIVTADHAIKREDDLHATLPGGETVALTVAGRDAGTDIAVLKADGAATTAPLKAADGESVRPGALILSVGRGGEVGTQAALGIVSAVRGPWQTWRGGRIDRYIRLDLNLYPGLSGGAVVNPEGELIGMATSALSRIAAVAVPWSTVERVVDELLAKGYVSRGYLGLGLQPVAVPDALGGGVGLMIVSLEPGGPAANAGLLLGDIITGMEGRQVGDTDDVQEVLSTKASGAEVRVSLVRAGERRELTVTLGERAPNAR